MSPTRVKSNTATSITTDQLRYNALDTVRSSRKTGPPINSGLFQYTASTRAVTATHILMNTKRKRAEDQKIFRIAWKISQIRITRQSNPAPARRTTIKSIPVVPSAGGDSSVLLFSGFMGYYEREGIISFLFPEMRSIIQGVIFE